MLAKQDTPIKARRTLLGFVPAKLRTRVIKTRSMLVLLKADEIVKPPISNMIVGENIAEKTNLRTIFSRTIRNREGFHVSYCVAAGGAIGTSSSSRMTRNKTRSSGTNIDVTKSGIAYLT